MQVVDCLICWTDSILRCFPAAETDLPMLEACGWRYYVQQKAEPDGAPCGPESLRIFSNVIKKWKWDMTFWKMNCSLEHVDFRFCLFRMGSIGHIDAESLLSSWPLPCRSVRREVFMARILRGALRRRNSLGYPKILGCMMLYVNTYCVKTAIWGGIPSRQAQLALGPCCYLPSDVFRFLFLFQEDSSAVFSSHSEVSKIYSFLYIYIYMIIHTYVRTHTYVHTYVRTYIS